MTGARTPAAVQMVALQMIRWISTAWEATSIIRTSIRSLAKHLCT